MGAGKIRWGFTFQEDTRTFGKEPRKWPEKEVEW